MSGAKVYVGKLSYRATEKDLDYFFRGYGKVVEIIIKYGFAFVEFADARDAEDAAYDLNGREVLGDRVTVEIAKGTPRGRDMYRDRMYSPPKYRSPPSKSSRRSRSRTPERRRRRTSTNDKAAADTSAGNRLRIENLSSRILTKDVKDAFKKFGEVTHVDAHTKRKNEGVVEFARKSDMRKALEEMDGQQLGGSGRKLKVVEDKKRKRSSSTKHRSRSVSKSKSRSRSGSLKRDGGGRKKSASKSRSLSAEGKSKESAKARSKGQEEDTGDTTEHKNGHEDGSPRQRKESVKSSDQNDDA